MAAIEVRPLAVGVPFGARVRGVTRAMLENAEIRRRLSATFIEHGVLVFEEVEQSSPMQVAISNLFGPLKDHPVASVQRVDGDLMPGVIVINTTPDGAVVEVDGQQLASWQPWHFDHCYNNELNRAGVLRSVVQPAELGLTGFADGIQIWHDLPDRLKREVSGREIIYTLDLLYNHMRYGKQGFTVVRDSASDILDFARTLPRAIHPASWTRETGETVFHMAPWMAHGVVDHESPEGDQWFEAVWAEALKVMKPYYHQWQGHEMVVWDNWRMLHRGMGCRAGDERVMHRTTIQGDYGLGHWEQAGSVGIAADVM